MSNFNLNLKPCPFCGSGEVELLRDANCGIYIWYVSCTQCEAASTRFKEPPYDGSTAYDAITGAISSAINAWNRRVPKKKIDLKKEDSQK